MQTSSIGAVAAGGRRVVAVIAVVAAVAVVAGGAGAAGLLAQSEGQLVERLAEIEGQLPALPPTEVTVAEDATWGELPGNYRSTTVRLDELEGPLRILFQEAADQDGSAAAAVADASRGLMVLHQAYQRLARWEEADLQFPLDGSDDRGVATGMDPRYGTAEAGLRLVLEGNARRLPAYRTLADSETVSEDQRELFLSRVEALETFHRDTRPAIRRLLSLATTQQLTPVDRFESRAPGVEARARSFTFVCVPREGPADGETPHDLRDVAASLGGDVAAAPDCTELDNDNTVQLSGR